jgi:hypothetical protein
MMLCGEDVDIRMRNYERLMRDGGGEPPETSRLANLTKRRRFIELRRGDTYNAANASFAETR